MKVVQIMNHARRRPQYVDLLVLMHLRDLVSLFVKSARRAWGVSIGLVLLVFLFGLALVGVIQ